MKRTSDKCAQEDFILANIVVVNSVGHEPIEWAKYLKDLSPVFKVHFVRCRREIYILNWDKSVGDYYCKFYLSTETFGFSNKFFKKVTSLFIILFRSIHNIFSKNDHIKINNCIEIAHTSLQHWMCRQIFAILTLSSISWTNFDMKLIVSFQS